MIRSPGFWGFDVSEYEKKYRDVDIILVCPRGYIKPEK